MSIPQKATICCPHCRKTYTATIFASINTDYAADLSKRIIEGSWFDSICPHCKQITPLEYDLLYHDMVHHAMIWLLCKDNNPDYQKKVNEIRATSHEGFLTRLVSSKGELREKVACLERGRDDRVIELCKVFMSFQLMEQVPDFQVEKVFYTLDGDKEVVFFYDANKNSIHSFLEEGLYKILFEQFKERIKSTSQAGYPHIDYAWASCMFISENPESQPNDAPFENTDYNNNHTIRKTVHIKQSNSTNTNKEPCVQFCRKCGKRLPEDSGYCQYCGTKIITVRQNTDVNTSPQDLTSQNNSNLSLINYEYETYGKVFVSHYRKAAKLCKKYIRNDHFREELLPAMFVITDYAALSAQKNRSEISKEIMPVINSLLNESFSLALFQKRVGLYGEIIRGKRLRAEWLFGNSTLVNKNAITKVGGLLGDILYNPACADDYDNAPVLLSDVQDVMRFSQAVMWPVVSELSDLFKDIYDT